MFYMKVYTMMFVLLLALLLVVPTLSLRRQDIPARQTTQATQAAASEETADDGTIAVFRAASGKVETVDTTDYLCGAVAAEISPTYADAAIMAQAVACHTYALYMRRAQTQKPDAALDGADLSDSPDTHQGYLSVEEQKKKWGEHYDAYAKKIRRCVEAVADRVMIYDGAPVMAAFHACNTGRTEDCANVWGAAVPYLVSVVSPGDALSPDAVKTQTFSAEEIREALEEKKIAVKGNAADWFGETVCSDAGTVLTVEICGETLKGSTVREALGLRSGAFEIRWKNKSFTVETHGYGHMIGMSQCGADYMAQQGFSWEEILLHYYPGVKIEKR